MDMVVASKMVFIRDTDKAVGFKQLVDNAFLTGTPKTHVDFWLPKSQIEEGPSEVGEVADVVIPRWLADRQDGLEFEAY